MSAPAIPMFDRKGHPTMEMKPFDEFTDEEQREHQIGRARQALNINRNTLNTILPVLEELYSFSVPRTPKGKLTEAWLDVVAEGIAHFGQGKRR